MDNGAYSLSVATATAAGGSSTTVSTTVVTSYTVTGEPTYTTTEVSDSTNSLQLRLLLSISSSWSSGVTVNATVDDYNTLASTNNVTVANEWVVALSGMNGLPCWQNSYPVGIAIARGYYTASNVTSANFLDLVNPNATFACPGYFSAFGDVAGYVFQPMSDMAASYGCVAVRPCLTQEVSTGVTVTGYWGQSGTFTYFPRGTYTVLAEDEWGNLAIAYFTVA